jgi:hypothetical protein
MSTCISFSLTQAFSYRGHIVYHPPDSIRTSLANFKRIISVFGTVFPVQIAYCLSIMIHKWPIFIVYIHTVL